jgi:hypothetical protein
MIITLLGRTRGAACPLSALRMGEDTTFTGVVRLVAGEAERHAGGPLAP